METPLPTLQDYIDRAEAECGDSKRAKRSQPCARTAAHKRGEGPRFLKPLPKKKLAEIREVVLEDANKNYRRVVNRIMEYQRPADEAQTKIDQLNNEIVESEKACKGNTDKISGRIGEATGKIAEFKATIPIDAIPPKQLVERINSQQRKIARLKNDIKMIQTAHEKETAEKKKLIAALIPDRDLNVSLAECAAEQLKQFGLFIAEGQHPGISTPDNFAWHTDNLSEDPHKLPVESKPSSEAGTHARPGNGEL